jgi:rhodanese-related sulfurtransferase
MEHTEGFLRLVEDAKSRIREISIEDARKRLASSDAVLLIDVREDHEFEAEHARGARHLSKGVIERDIEREVPDKKAEMILYCGGGYRSALAADNLQKMGYTNVLSLAGGWRAWQEAGAPTEKKDNES